MTKSELAEKIGENAGLSKTKAVEAVETVFAVLTDALADGESYTHTGFGSFSVQDRPERKGRNPQTGEEITIPASRVVKFNMGKKLKERLNP